MRRFLLQAAHTTARWLVMLVWRLAFGAPVPRLTDFDAVTLSLFGSPAVRGQA